MSEDFMLMEMPGAFERGQRGQRGLTRPDVARAGNVQDNGRQHSIPLGVVLTGYRLLTTIMIVGIGIPKAIYSYYGQSLVSPSLDWVGGIMFALLLFWLGVIEGTRPELCPGFFQDDLAPTILGFLGCNDNPSSLDPATLGSLRHDNTVPLAPPALEPLRRRGDTPSALAPEILGVLSDDTFPPLIPGIPRVPDHDDSGAPPPLDPATQGSLRRGATSPLTPPILGSLRRGDTSSPLAPEIPGGSSDDAFPPLAPEILGALRRGDTPAFSGIYLPSSSNSSGPMSPTAQLAGTTPDHENIAPATPGFKPLPRNPRSTFPQTWSYLDGNEREPEVDLTDLRLEEFQPRPDETSRTTSHAPHTSFYYMDSTIIRRMPERLRASASQVPTLPDLPCRLCRLMFARHRVESFKGFCSERHRQEWESYTRIPGRIRPQETVRASASRIPSHLTDLPCGLCGLMFPRHRVESFGGFCSERHKSRWERGREESQALP